MYKYECTNPINKLTIVQMILKINIIYFKYVIFIIVLHF